MNTWHELLRETEADFLARAVARRRLDYDAVVAWHTNQVADARELIRQAEAELRVAEYNLAHLAGIPDIQCQICGALIAPRPDISSLAGNEKTIRVLYRCPCGHLGYRTATVKGDTW